MLQRVRHRRVSREAHVQTHEVSFTKGPGQTVLVTVCEMIGEGDRIEAQRTTCWLSRRRGAEVWESLGEDGEGLQEDRPQCGYKAANGMTALGWTTETCLSPNEGLQAFRVFRDHPGQPPQNQTPPFTSCCFHIPAAVVRGGPRSTGPAVTWAAHHQSLAGTRPSPGLHAGDLASISHKPGGSFHLQELLDPTKRKGAWWAASTLAGMQAAPGNSF